MCLECTAESEARFLEANQQAQNGTIWGPQWEPLPPTPSLILYRISFLRKERLAVFPVEGCRGCALIHINLQNHFVQNHMQETIVILEEDN